MYFCKEVQWASEKKFVSIFNITDSNSKKRLIFVQFMTFNYIVNKTFNVESVFTVKAFRFNFYFKHIVGTHYFEIIKL